MAQEKSFRDVQVRSSEIGIRTIGLNDLWQSLKEGYDDFNATPVVGMFLAVLLYLVFALLFTLFLVGANLLHLAFPIVAGLTLIGPVVSVGFFEMSRRRETRARRQLALNIRLCPLRLVCSHPRAIGRDDVALCCLAVYGAVPLFRHLRTRPTSLGIRLCGPVSYDPAGRWTDMVRHSSWVPICRHCAGNFGGRLSVAPGQTGDCRNSGRRFDQSSSCQSYGDSGLGSDCCGAAGCGGDRVFDRPRGGPTYSGPCNLASIPQGR
jgi:hypothetical protein